MKMKLKEMQIAQTYRADSAPHKRKSAFRGLMQRLGSTLLVGTLIMAATACPNPSPRHAVRGAPPFPTRGRVDATVNLDVPCQFHSRGSTSRLRFSSMVSRICVGTILPALSRAAFSASAKVLREKSEASNSTPITSVRRSAALRSSIGNRWQVSFLAATCRKLVIVGNNPTWHDC